MGFKENLKDELRYQGVLVKELAAKSGVPKGTIDHYLAEKSASPIAENAVKIARALNVTVEYLVTGKDFVPSKSGRPPYSAQIRALAEKLSCMNQKQLKLSSVLISVIETEG
ncbi:MAG: helix-turn-helix transcriptional regulator [Treponema sp.]|nr:helix-turn-helix transcriptional regulator [Treponema sp.]